MSFSSEINTGLPETPRHVHNPHLYEELVLIYNAIRALQGGIEDIPAGAGSQGFQGFQGSQGSQGVQGFQGSQGLQGSQGSQGVQGSTGSQGNQGNQGFQGAQGTQGTTGAQGNQGAQGFQGFQGNQGTAGTGVSGLTATRIPYASGATSLVDTVNLVWDNANTALLIGGQAFSSGYLIKQSASLNGNCSILNENRSNGAGAFGGYYTWNDLGDGGGATALIRTSSGFTPSGNTLADQTILQGRGAGGLFVHVAASKSISFGHGAALATATRTMQIEGTGDITFGPSGSTVFKWDAANARLSLGTATSTALRDIYLQKTSNASIGITAENLSTGTAGVAQIVARNSANSILIGKYSTGWTSTDLRAPDVGLLFNSNGTLVIVNNGTGPTIYSASLATAGEYMRVLGAAGSGSVAGNIGIGAAGGVTNPTAYLHIKAGTATAGTAPLKLTSGTNNTTAETGAFEYNGTNLFFTRTGTTRESVCTGTNGAAAPSTSVGVAITNYYGTAATNFLGDPNSWAAVNIGGVAYKIPLYT